MNQTQRMATTPMQHETPAHEERAPLAEVRGVSKLFGQTSQGLLENLARRLGLSRRAAVARALDNVDLTILPGEAVGLVGESGCGKSTLARIVAGILEPTEGSVRIASKDPRQDRSVHLTAQMIFQDPQASLNPRMRVDRIIGEAPVIHGMATARTIDAYVCHYMEQAGVDPSLRYRYPHQFSGGQRQRIGIARALAVQPKLLVCDEAVAALDVSIQAQILNLFMDLRSSLGLSYLFISHDLRTVQHLCERVVIMYLGRVVEAAPAATFFAAANHPYARALLGEIPDLSVRRKIYTTIKGDIPSPLAPPSGCHFHPRCPSAMARCRIEVPKLRQVSPDHMSACHLNDPPIA